MTQKTDTKKMRDELKAAADAAITMAKQLRGSAIMATDPETYENAIKHAYHEVGVAIAFRMTANRYQHIDETATYDLIQDLRDQCTTAELQADAANALNIPAQEMTYRGAAECYFQLAELIEKGQWKEDEQ